MGVRIYFRCNRYACSRRLGGGEVVFADVIEEDMCGDGDVGVMRHGRPRGARMADSLCGLIDDVWVDSHANMGAKAEGCVGSKLGLSENRM